MVETGSKAIEWIHSRRPFGQRPGLERVKALLALVDHPEKKYQQFILPVPMGKVQLLAI